MKTIVRLSVFSTALIFAGLGDTRSLAQTPTAIPATNTSQVTISTPAPSSLGKPAIYAGLKSYNDSGRVIQMNDSKGRTFKSKNEYFLGIKTDKGFGFFGQGVENIYRYNEKGSAGNKTIPQDPSVTLMHPIYKDDRLNINGAFREYFPVSDNSINRKQYQQAYYLNVTYKMKNKLDLFNQLIPRYFSQSFYKPTDTLWYAEDYTTLTTKANDWFRYGLGQRTQLEIHSGTATGNCMEVYPMADFMISNSIFVGPRIFFPVAAQNSVVDGPTNVSTGNVYAEIYLQATL